MTLSVYQYRIYCATDTKYVTTWATEEPSVCPENNTHNITSNLTIIINEICENKIVIKEENTPTGGFFKLDMLKFIAPKNTITKHKFSFDFPINLLSVRLITEDIHKGDILTWSINPETPVGVLTANYTPVATWSSQNYLVNDLVKYQASSVRFPSIYKCIENTINNENPSNETYWKKQNTTLNVSRTVIENAKIGFFITLTDGVNTDIIGYVTAVNVSAGTISVNGTPEHNFNTNSPTLVKITVYYMDNVELGPAMNYNIGSDKIGASYIPIGTHILSIYDNKSDNDKSIITYLEYLY